MQMLTSEYYQQIEKSLPVNKNLQWPLGMSRLRGDRAYWDRLGRPSARRVLGVWGGRGMEGRRRVPRVLPALLSRLSHSLLGQLSSSSSEDRPETREKTVLIVLKVK